MTDRDPTPTGNLEIARAQPEDLNSTLTLFDEAVAWLNRKGIPGQWGTEPFSSNPRFAQRLAAWIESGVLYTARRGGELLGVIAISPDAPRYAATEVQGRPGPAFYLEAFTTRRSEKGQGVGRALLEFAEAHARLQGAAWLRLDCWAGNPDLCAYYERAGYQPFGQCRLGEWVGQLFEKPVQ